MKDSIALVFILFAIMLSGVFLSSWNYIRDEYFESQETKFWISSIAFAITGLLLFGVGTATSSEVIKSNSIIFTFAHLFYIASIVFQALFCASLNKPVSKRFVYISILGTILFAIHYEYLRGSGNFVGRVLEVAAIVSFLLLFQLMQLYKTLKTQSSIQLKFLFAFTLLEIIAVVSRVIIAALQANPVSAISEIPFPLLAILWLNLAFNALSYLTMLGFWSERSVSRQLVMSLENERISSLLQERERLVSSLLTANKSSATGALSASLAHELNQPIGASRVNLFTLRKTLGDKAINDVAITEIISRMEQDNHRAGDIIGALRSVFTQERDISQSASISGILNSVISLIRGECGKLGIILHIETADARVTGNRIELQQVFLNLLNNAMDALRSVQSGQERTIWISSKIQDKMVQITISDNGPGVLDELTPQLFELFESQKKAGMGIGLWLSKYIVERIDGSISYAQRLGGGSQFTVAIPLKRDTT